MLQYYLPVLKYVDNLHPIPDDDFFKVTLLVRDELTFQVAMKSIHFLKSMS